MTISPRRNPDLLVSKSPFRVHVPTQKRGRTEQQLWEAIQFSNSKLDDYFQCHMFTATCKQCVKATFYLVLDYKIYVIKMQRCASLVS